MIETGNAVADPVATKEIPKCALVGIGPWLSIPLAILQPVTIRLRRTTICRLLKLQKCPKGKKSVAWCLTPCFSLFVMPNQPSPDRAYLGLRLSRELKILAEREAKRRHMTLTDFVCWIIEKETEHLELTPDDYRKIANEIERAKRGLLARHAKASHGGKGEGGGPQNGN
ncbi:MAG: hypothetical protein DVB31_13105 [Verrucomicrobia bacterium]|nr:MAG: hypothetical protein DVB31_13105 [Verrucomicrobiota bacterium]